MFTEKDVILQYDDNDSVWENLSESVFHFDDPSPYEDNVPTLTTHTTILTIQDPEVHPSSCVCWTASMLLLLVLSIAIGTSMMRRRRVSRIVQVAEPATIVVDKETKVDASSV